MSYLFYYSVIQKREFPVSISSQYIPQKTVQTQSLVLFNQVKPARRQEYIRFFHEILSPALCSLVRDQACQARLLEPTVANDDGNYTYVLLVEPAYEGVDYSIPTVCNTFYGERQSRVYLKTWSDTLARVDGRYLLISK